MRATSFAVLYCLSRAAWAPADALLAPAAPYSSWRGGAVPATRNQQLPRLGPPPPYCRPRRHVGRVAERHRHARACAAAADAEGPAISTPTAATFLSAPRRLTHWVRERVSLKYLALSLLVLQNAYTAILAASTRRPRLDGSPLYLGSAAVLVAELMKLPTCLALIARDEGGLRGTCRTVKQQVLARDTLRMGVPALCYGLQNMLYWVSLSHLSATTYQLWAQSKTLFTALFFVLLLGRRLAAQQWLALCLLTAGVGLVQYSAMGGAAAAAAGASSALPAGAIVGICAVLCSSLLSGFANVYFEKVIKGKTDGAPVSIWVRNVQLSMFSIPQAALLLLGDRVAVATRGLLSGFDAAVWCVVALKALGGLIVAAVVKYADNVMKTYATAIAIVLTLLASCASSRSLPSLGLLQGMALVIVSIFGYNLGPNALNPRSWFTTDTPKPILGLTAPPSVPPKPSRKVREGEPEGGWPDHPGEGPSVE